MQLQALERRSTFTSSYTSYISHEVSLLYSHNTQHCSSYRLQKVTFLPLQQERAFIMVINSAVECHAPALQWKDCDITLYYNGSGRCTGFDLEVKLQLFHSGYASTHTSNWLLLILAVVRFVWNVWNFRFLSLLSSVFWFMLICSALSPCLSIAPLLTSTFTRIAAKTGNEACSLGIDHGRTSSRSVTSAGMDK